MTNRCGDHFVNKLMDGLVMGVFKQDANAQYQYHDQ